MVNSKRKTPKAPPPTCLTVYAHPDCAGHDTYNAAKKLEHQENATRVDEVRERLERLPGVAFCGNFTPASDEALLRVHSAAYLQVLSSIDDDFASGKLEQTEPLSPRVVPALFPGAQICGMTMVSRGSLRAARRAAGAVLAAIDDVLDARAGCTPRCSPADAPGSAPGGAPGTGAKKACLLYTSPSPRDS